MWVSETNHNMPDVIDHLNERLGVSKEKHPDFFLDMSTSKEIYCFSDYTGDDFRQPYHIINYYIVDWQSTKESYNYRYAFRKKKFGFEREFQFKKLNKDKERLRLLSDFLNTFESVYGVAFTILVDRDFKYLFTGCSPHKLLFDSGMGDYKPHIAEKILRVLHFQALLIHGLNPNPQSVLWMTDRDAICKNFLKLGELYQSIFDIYTESECKSLYYKQPLGTLKEPYLDFMAIPDLIGGAAMELLRGQSGAFDETKFQKTRVSEKSRKIIQWYAKNSLNFKKVYIRIYPTNGMRGISIFRTQPEF